MPAHNVPLPELAVGVPPPPWRPSSRGFRGVREALDVHADLGCFHAASLLFFSALSNSTATARRRGWGRGWVETLVLTIVSVWASCGLLRRSGRFQVIVGNPPWSAGQKSSADDNPNVDYPELEKRVAKTYAARGIGRRPGGK